ncbi:MAG: hypothetical protein M1819_004748 [Sarea resinae]|nr:MAG: hypothetical protein M1819_004748 [Sarea resinae]
MADCPRSPESDFGSIDALRELNLQSPENATRLVPRRPAASRALSSPPSSPEIPRIDTSIISPLSHANGIMTPPETPTKVKLFHDQWAKADNLLSPVRISNSTSGLDRPHANLPDGVGRNAESPTPTRDDTEQAWKTITQPRTCLVDYELEGNEAGTHEIFGKGAWSVVYKARERDPAATAVDLSLPSPPSSPQCDRKPQTRRILAVKAPGRRDARPILEKEARILTYLQPLYRDSPITQYMTVFHGFDESISGLVLEAVPITLANYSTQQAKKVAKKALVLKKDQTVAVGMTTWLRFAEHLINGLAFLHDQAIVHGDITPSNILLRPSSPSVRISEDEDKIAYTPIYCDFSSASISHPAIVAEETPAWRTEFTAPEIIRAQAQGAPAIASFSTDVFALAVSLLMPVTGSMPYADYASPFQARHAASQGEPLAYVLGLPSGGSKRGITGSKRTGEMGAVERVIGNAVAKSPEERLTAEVWAERVQEAVSEWE